jgi:predicted metal-dependent enzyme (double-stranded beta helix superfamily)
MPSSSPLQSFAARAERHVDDPEAIGAELAGLLADDGWLAPEHRIGARDGYRQHVLHVSETGRLSIVALVWLPGQRTPIHDHVSWCVVGVLQGRERETRYRAVEVDGRPCLEAVGTVDADPGHVEVIVPPVDDIHAVTAVATGPTISIHVYGADVRRLGSSILRRFDGWPVIDRPAPEPFAAPRVVEVTRAGRAWTHPSSQPVELSA